MEYAYHIDYMQVKCPKCGKTPKSSQSVGEAFIAHICYNSCGYQFWTLKICPHCKEPQRTIFLNKPNFGQKIRCSSCGHSMYYFRCPNRDCLELFYKDEDFYKMGSNVSCVTCNHTYKLITCLCGGETLCPDSQTIFEGYNLFKCTCCAKEFTFTICPACHSPEFHLDKLDVGDRIRCSTCKLWRRYVPCPRCGKSLKGQRFCFCEPNKCTDCGVVFEYSKCPYGCSGLNYNLLEKPMGPVRGCFQCKRNYFVINCRKCQQSLYLEQIDKSVGNIDFCPHCKIEMRYYLCGTCGNFNERDAFCSNQACPKPVNTIDTTKKKPEKQNPSQKSSEAVDDDCKICFSAKVQVINETCSHLMMCEACLKSIQVRRQGQPNVPCPICKQIGRYFRYRAPIYS